VKKNLPHPDLRRHPLIKISDLAGSRQLKKRKRRQGDDKQRVRGKVFKQRSSLGRGPLY